VRGRFGASSPLATPLTPPPLAPPPPPPPRAPSPDGTKKAFVRLSPDYDALDVANKIGII
jgi:hypothetical protein